MCVTESRVQDKEAEWLSTSVTVGISKRYRERLTRCRDDVLLSVSQQQKCRLKKRRGIR